MNATEAQEFIRTHKQAVVVTVGKSGRPQTSNVLVVLHEGRFLLSTTEGTSKFRNMTRDPRVVVHLLGDSFWQWLAVEGTAAFTRMPDALSMLHQYYELATGGPHADWEEYDRAMAAEGRVMVSISIDRMYPLLT